MKKVLDLKQTSQEIRFLKKKIEKLEERVYSLSDLVEKRVYDFGQKNLDKEFLVVSGNHNVKTKGKFTYTENSHNGDLTILDFVNPDGDSVINFEEVKEIWEK